MRVIIAAVACLLVLAASAVRAQSPVSLTAKVRAKSVRLEVVGPPRAAFAVLVSPSARGGFFQDHPIDVEFLHPVENVIGGGELDDEGRGAVEAPCRESDLGGVEEVYLQAVAFASEDVRRVFGVSGTLRFRPGPPPEVTTWRRPAWRPWLLLIVVITGVVVGSVGRRRGVDLRARFGPAAMALVVVGFLTLPDWPRVIPEAFARHGLSQERADARILGDRLAAAIAGVPAHVGDARAIRIALPPGGRWVAPRILQYHVYPLRLVGDEAAVESVRRAGAAVLLLAADGVSPPHGFEPVPGFRSPGFRLHRTSEGGRP